MPGGNEQALQQFINQSPGEHEPLQLALINYAMPHLKTPKNNVLVLDDTTLPKKGKYSVGIGRQYCSTLGKIANCQSIVNWHYAGNGKMHYPLLSDAHLPKSWCDEDNRMHQ